jgi:hypothetical protein
MMASSVRQLMAVSILSVSLSVSKAQPPASQTIKKEARPYQILTLGKQIIIKSNRTIEHIMLWTTSGHRVVEQRDINAVSYTFTIPIDEKIFFLMLGLEGGKIYTEKIGIQ